MYNTNPNDNYSNAANSASYTPSQGSYGQVPPALYATTPTTTKTGNKKTLLGIIAGVALLCAAAGSMNGHKNNGGGFGQPQGFTPAQTSMYTPQNSNGQTPQYNGQPSQYNDNSDNGYEPSTNGGYSPQSGGYVPQNGGYAYNTPSVTPSSDNGSSDITDGYWEQQRRQAQSNQAFDEYIRDTNTVQDQNGTIYTDVDNSVANPAIDAGVVTEVPTNELPTSYDTPAAAPEAPAAVEAPAADTSSASE